MKSSPQHSLGLSTLFNFYSRSKVPLTELERFEDQFEPTGEHNGSQLWTPRIGRTEDEVRRLNEWVMDWVWHFRDYFWKYGEQHLGISRKSAVALTEGAVANSDALKLCGFFTNLRKHVEVDTFKSYPTFKSSPPRLGDVRVHFLMDNGDTTYKTDLRGAEYHQVSSRFAFIQTVEIEDFPGDKDTRRVAEEACWEWIALLKANGIDLGVMKPTWFECEAVIDFLGVGTSPQALAAQYICFPDGIVTPPLKWTDLDNLEIRFDGAFEHPTD